MHLTNKPKVLYTTADTSLQSGAFNSLLYMSSQIETWGYAPSRVLHEDARNSSLTADAHIPTYFMQLPRPKLGKSPSYYLSYCLNYIPSVSKLVSIIKQEKISLVH